MFTTFSFGTKQTVDSYHNPRYPGHQTKRLLEKQIISPNGSKVLSKTYSSTSILLNVLREIQTKHELKERRLRRDTFGNESVFEYLNENSRLYKWKHKVFRFFNKPDNIWSICYHISVFLLVFTCLIFTVFSTISRYSETASKVLIILEKLIIFWFCNEFCLRLWSSSCKQKYFGWKGKLRYLRIPSHLLDLIVIILSLVVLTTDSRNGSEVFAVSAFRGFHRLFQVFQMLTLHRQIQPWRLLLDVVKDQMHELLIIIYIQFISIFILAYISYILEKDAPDNQFTSLAEAMWWAVITLSTIGYGDKVHVTWWGKLISSIFTILGVAMFALPAGIIGAGLAIRIEKEETNRQKKNRKLAAIVLIQSMWRCYKVDSLEDFDPKAKKPFILNKSNDKTVAKFLSLIKFFVAKSKFKSTRNITDLENSVNYFKFNQINVNLRVKRIEDMIQTIDKDMDSSETAIMSHQKNLINKIENICHLINYITKQINRQNLLMDRFQSL